MLRKAHGMLQVKKNIDNTAFLANTNSNMYSAMVIFI